MSRLEARIHEAGNGHASAGDYVVEGGSIYLVVSAESVTRTDMPLCGNYVLATIEEADWSDCAEGDEHPADVVVLGDAS